MTPKRSKSPTARELLREERIAHTKTHTQLGKTEVALFAAAELIEKLLAGKGEWTYADVRSLQEIRLLASPKFS